MSFPIVIPLKHYYYYLSIRELEEWMATILAHCHKYFMDENNIDSDYWEQGTIETQFWRVPPSSQRSPVAIRSLPFANGIYFVIYFLID